MKKHTLNVSVRTQTGKTVKMLRKQGILPGTVYGKDMKSISVQFPTDAFVTLYKEAGETGLVELVVDGKVLPVLVHSVQVHAVTDSLIHVEFHKVNLKEKIHAKVSIEQTGESPASAQKLGVLLVLHDAIEVEALPTDLPEKISVDLTRLTGVGSDITAGSVELPSGVTLISDPTLVLVKIGQLVTKEAEAEVAADAAQAADAAAVVEEAAAQDKAEVAKEAADKSSDK